MRDGLAYTKEEFGSFYHGLREWNRAQEVYLGETSASSEGESADEADFFV